MGTDEHKRHIMGRDRLTLNTFNCWGQTNSKLPRHPRLRVEYIQQEKSIWSARLGGWFFQEILLLLHLTSWNLPVSQLSWESKMEPSVAILLNWTWVIISVQSGWVEWLVDHVEIRLTSASSWNWDELSWVEAELGNMWSWTWF